MKLFRMIAGALLATVIAAPALAQNNVGILVQPVVQGAAVPVVTNTGNTASFVAGGSPAPVDPAIGVTCVCSTLTSATVTISAGQFAGDTLSAVAQSGIAVSFSTPTLTLSGNAPVTAYVQALQSVTYGSSAGDPTNGGSNPTRTIAWRTFNGAIASNLPSSTVTVATPGATPIVTAGGATATFVSPSPPVAVDPAIGISCGCTNLTGATATIAAGLLGGDSLSATLVGVITQSYNSTTGVLTLSGTDTVANYQTVLRSMVYSSSIGDPTNGGADSSRSISIVATNGLSSSANVIEPLNVALPAVPTITIAAGNTVSYTAGGAAVAVDGTLNLTCSCTNLTSMTLTLSTGFLSGDTFAASAAFGITPVYNPSTGVMTLSGTTTVANYQTLARTIVYSSSAGDPTNGGLDAQRTVTWVAINGANSSPPQTTSINVFASGQPAFALTNATVAINAPTGQCWINGTGTGPMSACVQVARNSIETCHTTASTVVFEPVNTLCPSYLGLPTFPIYSNYVLGSQDMSDVTKWVSFTTGTGSSISRVQNSAVAPDGTTTAAKITLTRTTAGNTAEIVNNTIQLPSTGAYSAGVWLKADGVGDVNGQIAIATLSSTSFQGAVATLTSSWQWFPFNNFQMGACNNNCQLGIGLNASVPGNGSLSVNVDVWGGQMNAGPVVFPVYPTTTSIQTTAADVNTAIPGSALETAIKGTASSLVVITAGGVNGQVATIVDSNGTTILGENASNNLATALGSAASTVNIAPWGTGTQQEGYSRDSTGRSMALNNSVVFSDSQATSVATPIYFGSTLGTSNFFDGYIQTLNAFNTRVQNSVIGVPGSGKNTFFASAAHGGADTNDCLAGTVGGGHGPCLTMAKAQSVGLVTNDVMAFNGGDTFTGCMTFTGGTNWNATAVAPATITSYGTGQAILTGNCTAASGRIGIINFSNADGGIINNLEFLGDAAGNAGDGILWQDTTRQTNHGNFLVENNLCTGIHDVGAIFGNGCFAINNNNGQRQYQNFTFLNNTDQGASPTATDNNFYAAFSDNCTIVNFTFQGNLALNLGGATGVTGSQAPDGNMYVLSGVCGAGSIPYSSPRQLASPLTIGATAIFNVSHDLGKNSQTCGGNFAQWVFQSDSIIQRMNEAYNQGATPASCDHGAWDFDIATNNSLLERNYSHNNFGPCILLFQSGTTTAPNTVRWNVCDSDNSAGNLGTFTVAGNSVFFAYNNDLTQSGTGTQTSGSPSFAIDFNGCPPAPSLFANNIITVPPSSGFNNNRFLVSSQANTTSICQTTPLGGILLANNDWFSRRTTGVNYVTWVDNQGITGTFNASISGTTLTINSSVSGSLKGVGEIVTGAGVAAGTRTVGCTAPCFTLPAVWQVNIPQTVAAETMTITAVSSSFADFENLIGETGGQNVDPLFSNPYQNTACNNTTSGPQGAGCPAGFTLQSGSTMHGAGAVLTSAPWNLPNPGLFNGQGTKDYYGNNLPCAAPNASFPIGAAC